MSKLIILSIVLVTIGVPTWLSTSPQPRKALRRAQGIIALYVILWAYLCLHVYPDLAPLK
jgi:hypothetical protein